MADGITKDELSETLADVLDERGFVDQKTHRHHHDWVDLQIEKAFKKSEFWRKLKEQVFGWMLIGSLAGIAISALDWLKFVFKKIIGE